MKFKHINFLHAVKDGASIQYELPAVVSMKATVIIGSIVVRVATLYPESTPTLVQ